MGEGEAGEAGSYLKVNLIPFMQSQTTCKEGEE